MTSNALLASAVLAGLVGSLAAAMPAAAEEHLNETQQTGRRLYEQSCAVCHTKPTLISGLYGPELNRQTAGGDAEVIRGVVTNGTPRMPAFKYTYNPTQIAAIASYVVTLAPGHQNDAPPNPQR
jgi:mono/diheme cytochrome c family protein